MHPVGVQQRVGEEAPQLGARAAGQNAVGECAGVITRRHEGQAPHQHAIDVGGEQPFPHRVHDAEQGEQYDHDGRDIEDRLVPLVQESSLTRLNPSLRDPFQ